jgi:hypothetical protein
MNGLNYLNFDKRPSTPYNNHRGVIVMSKGDVKPGPVKNPDNNSKKDSRKKGRSGPKKREK